MTFKTLSLAIVVATFLLATTIPPSSSDDWGPFNRNRYYVHIINELSRNKVLTAQCNCVDNPQPVTYVKAGAEYKLTFREHLFRATRWSCNLIADKNRHVWFVAYYEDIQSFDFNVYWAAREDGVYFRNPDGPDTFQFQWRIGPKPSASNL